MTNNFKLLTEIIEQIKTIPEKDLDEAIRMINEAEGKQC